MERVAAIAVFVLFLAACSGDQVQLLTGVDRCFGVFPVEGTLLANPTSGTTIDGEPVMWPKGFTGRRVGSEVAVSDPQGNVVATTGKRYRLAEGGAGPNPPAGVFYACGTAVPLS
jgi:hypothetical protein